MRIQLRVKNVSHDGAGYFIRFVVEDLDKNWLTRTIKSDMIYVSNISDAEPRLYAKLEEYTPGKKPDEGQKLVGKILRHIP